MAWMIVAVILCIMWWYFLSYSANAWQKYDTGSDKKEPLLPRWVADAQKPIYFAWAYQTARV